MNHFYLTNHAPEVLSDLRPRQRNTGKMNHGLFLRLAHDGKATRRTIERSHEAIAMIVASSFNAPTSRNFRATQLLTTPDRGQGVTPPSGITYPNSITES